MNQSRTKSYELVLTALFSAIIIIMAFTPLGYIPLIVINATIIQIPVILGSLFCGPKKGALLGFIFGLTSFLKNTLSPTSLSAFVFSPVLAASLVGPSGIIKSTLICFVPRILVGIVPYYVFKGIQKIVKSRFSKQLQIICSFGASVILLFAVKAFSSRLLPEGSGKGLMSWMIGIFFAVIVFIVLIFMLKKQIGTLPAYIYAGLSGAITNTLLVMPMIYIFYKDAYAKALNIESDAVIGTILGIISFNGVVEAIVAAVLVSAIGIVLCKAVSQK